jgi:predicted esterase
VEAEVSCDPLRWTLAGSSQGAIGVMSILRQHQNLFAGAILCSGMLYDSVAKELYPPYVPSPDTDAQAATDLATVLGTYNFLQFTGQNDATVASGVGSGGVGPPNQQLFRTASAGNSGYSYTEYAGGGHNTWDTAFAGVGGLWTTILGWHR